MDGGYIDPSVPLRVELGRWPGQPIIRNKKVGGGGGREELPSPRNWSAVDLFAGDPLPSPEQFPLPLVTGSTNFLLPLPLSLRLCGLICCWRIDDLVRVGYLPCLGRSRHRHPHRLSANVTTLTDWRPGRIPSLGDHSLLSRTSVMLLLQPPTLSWVEGPRSRPVRSGLGGYKSVNAISCSQRSTSTPSKIIYRYRIYVYMCWLASWLELIKYKL
jgi:hypothetical protein